MSNDLHIAFVACPESFSKITNKKYNKYKVDSLKQLVLLCIEKPLDIVVFGAEVYQSKKIEKIFKKYQIPSFVLDTSPRHTVGVLDFCKADQITHKINEHTVEIISYRNLRLEQQTSHIMEKITLFTNQVIRTTKELFVSEAKKFFRDHFEMERCHWVEVREVSSKLPPVLNLKQELKKQKVDQSSLLSQIDSCDTKVVSHPDFQIWRTKQGHSMIFLWVPGPTGFSQCIILNQLKVTDLKTTEKLMKSLMPFLHRRWDLCLTVEEAQQQIYKDSLTDLYNQRFLNEVLDKKIEENKRYKTPFSVLFIDVDHFKKVNDSRGHLVGSGVLGQMGDLLKEQIRNSDYAFRYGGDEFIILLSHTEGQDAIDVAERIRAKVQAHQFQVNEVEVKVTVSIGLAFYPEHAQSAQEIVRIADEAMYYGKNKSRNIVYKAS